MILTKRRGDLLDLAENREVDVVVHQANLFHTFGAGIARQIALRFPYAEFADSLTERGSSKKLGSYSIGTVSQRPVIVNLYSQPTLYPSHTSYDNMFEGLTRLRNDLEPLPEIRSIGFPYQMGSGLADGNWNVVEAIIKAVFEDSRFEIVIVKLPETKSISPEIRQKQAEFWDRKTNTIT